MFMRNVQDWQQSGPAAHGNLYAYVGDDPINKTDPTGTYECFGDKKQCGAVAASINKIKEAARSDNLTRKERNQLNRVVSFFGKEGQKNGVGVLFRSPKEISTALGNRRGVALTVHGAKDHNKIGVVLPTNFSSLYDGLKGSPSNIGRDLSGFSSADERANILAHEGQHGIDIRAAGGYISNPEPSAYATGRLVNKGLGSVSIHDIRTDRREDDE